MGIIDLNVFAGEFEDKGKPDNYSAISKKNVRIPVGQQMLYKGHIDILGHWQIDGEIVEVTDQIEQFFYDTINNGDVVVVETDRLLLFNGHLQIDGHLRINGRLAEV